MYIWAAPGRFVPICRKHRNGRENPVRIECRRENGAVKMPDSRVDGYGGVAV